MRPSTIPYYLQSLPTLLTQTNPSTIPLIFIKHPQVLNLKGHFPLNIDRFMDIWTAKEVVLDNQYQQFYQVPPHGIVIDVGASIGDFSIMISQTADHVYASEMDPNRLELLSQNIKMNRRHNITIIPGQLTTLTDIFTRFHLKHCDYLKIDCEGNEYGIFQTTPDKHLQQIDYMAMEVHFFTPSMTQKYRLLTKRLVKLGFTLKELPNAVHTNIGFLFASRLKD